jgi:biotin carboxylase
MTAGVCAIVDAYSTGRFLRPALARHGIRVVHVQSTLAVPAYRRRTFDADGFKVRLRYDGDFGALAQCLRELGVSHVVAGSESGVSLADRLSAALGTRGHGRTCPDARRNKQLMAEELRRHGLDAARGIATGSLDEAEAWFRTNLHWPVVLKPVDSAGSDNVRVCADRDAARQAFTTILAARNRTGQPNQQVLVQEYLQGIELFANTVSWSGRHHIAEIWRYVKRRTAEGAVVYDYEEPVPPGDGRVARLTPYLLAALDALEIRHGAAHTEFVMTARGPILIDCGARLAGSILPSAVSRCFGTNQVELLAQAIAASEGFRDRAGGRYSVEGALRYVSLICARNDGRLHGGAVERLRKLPTFADLFLVVPPGGRVRRTIDAATSPGYLYLFGAHADVERDYARLRELEEMELYGA